MKKLKTIAALLLALVLAPSLAACGENQNNTNQNQSDNNGASSNVVYRTLDEIKAAGTVNIGVFSDKNPFGYVDENGDYAGYDVYFAERIGQDLGVSINYVSTEAANRVEYLETGSRITASDAFCFVGTGRFSRRFCSSQWPTT